MAPKTQTRLLYGLAAGCVAIGAIGAEESVWAGTCASAASAASADWAGALLSILVCGYAAFVLVACAERVISAQAVKAAFERHAAEASAWLDARGRDGSPRRAGGSPGGSR